ncbi:hypothetical protein LEP1GSC062_1315 [Leptospira alexanderi serovar Manhao 3 str. L 60]|uniref:Uncharacterized protein n=1 Tax=Leptospira alexanderi serovar Manhao 3 str. L 60 TaxID=1049759 RepID=V6HW71_9LEPT|nr:hypothetical protein LEP1GSC062_1315 [Leptospira alexanderi serovar Manhao 3 str. L 60]
MCLSASSIRNTQKEGDSEEGTLTEASSIASPGQSQNWKILIHKKNAKESCQGILFNC